MLMCNHMHFHIFIYFIKWGIYKYIVLLYIMKTNVRLSLTKFQLHHIQKPIISLANNLIATITSTN